MGRPPTSLGTAGKIRVYRDRTGWVAHTIYRDHDGTSRQVERSGRTKGEAQRRLAESIRDRTHLAGSADLNAETRISELAEAWFTSLDGRSPQTLRNYRDRLDNQVIPSLGKLRVRELSVGAVDRHLRDVRDRHGAATAKLVRSVLSGMCNLACRRGALISNPCRDAAPIAPAAVRRTKITLTAEQARQVRALLTYDHEAVRRDVVDLVDFMMATGCRVGEACALSWNAVDLQTGRVDIRATVIRVPHAGLSIKAGTKTTTGARALLLPDWELDSVRSRVGMHDELVFPSELGQLRDPSNTLGALKAAFVRIGWPDLTSHVFRRTVATLMDEAGLSARAAADQLGHAKVSITQDHYYGRRLLATGAADVLAIIGG